LMLVPLHYFPCNFECSLNLANRIFVDMVKKSLYPGYSDRFKQD
jgi:hypothetical protein